MEDKRDVNIKMNSAEVNDVSETINEKKFEKIK